METLKLSEPSSVLSDETGKALSQAPLSFCAVASNLALDTWSASINVFSQPLNLVTISEKGSGATHLKLWKNTVIPYRFIDIFWINAIWHNVGIQVNQQCIIFQIPEMFYAIAVPN